MAENVKFLKGTAAQYAAIQNKDVNAFYFTSDDNKLYLGAMELTTEADIVTAMNLVNNSTKGNEALYSTLSTLVGSGTGSISARLAALKTEIEGEVVNTITNGNNGITVGGTATAKTIGLKLSQKTGNNLQILTSSGEEGLYLNVPAATDYTVAVTESTPTGYAKAYTITQAATGLSATINIPKDMVVQSGAVETKSSSGAWGSAGTYLVLTLANASSDKVYINVGNLIEYVTSGSQSGDMIVVSISNDHKVTATITDGTVTKAKLASAVQTSLGKADTAVQSVTAGDSTSGNGTIKVDGTVVSVYGLQSAAYTASTAYATSAQGTKADTAIQGIAEGTSNGQIRYTINGTDYTNVSVHGLGSAAYTASTAYDAAGSANTALQNAKTYADGLLTWKSMA